MIEPRGGKDHGDGAKSKLAANTYNLLCSQGEFMESGAAAAAAAASGGVLKLNREVQAYLSLPYLDQHARSGTQSRTEGPDARRGVSTQHAQLDRIGVWP